MKVKPDGEWQSPIAKFFTEEGNAPPSLEELDAVEGDLLFFGADKPAVVCQVLFRLRLELARRLDLLKKDQFNFLWVTDFPAGGVR